MRYSDGMLTGKFCRNFQNPKTRLLRRAARLSLLYAASGAGAPGRRRRIPVLRSHTDDKPENVSQITDSPGSKLRFGTTDKIQTAHQQHLFVAYLQT